jgi:Tfp pilus assembly protein PilN
MKPIHIDFAPRSLKRSVLLTEPLMGLFLAIGFLLCSSAGIMVLSIIKQNTLLAEHQRMEVQQEEGINHHVMQSAWSISDKQASSVNNAIAQLNLPWRDLLDAIEMATPSNIALLAIEPDSKKQIIKGMAEAKTSSAMISYLERLKKQELFEEVVLTKHEINDQDPNKPYRFQFEAQWILAGREGQ